MNDPQNTGPAFLELGPTSVNTTTMVCESDPFRLFKPTILGDLELNIRGILDLTEQEIENLGLCSQELIRAIRGLQGLRIPLRCTLITGRTGEESTAPQSDEALAKEFLQMMNAPEVPDPELF